MEAGEGGKPRTRRVDITFTVIVVSVVALMVYIGIDAIRTWTTPVEAMGTRCPPGEYWESPETQACVAIPGWSAVIR